MEASANRVELGRLNGAWGAAGWVKIYSLTQPAENIFEFQPWQSPDLPGPLRVRQWRRQGRRLVAQIEEIDSRDRAEALDGISIFVDRDELPRPEAGTWYWHDLVGLAVFNREGRAMGKVRRLLDAGVHDVLEIERGQAQADLLIPFVPGHFVDEVDLDGGCITVDWQPEWTDAD